MPPRRNDRNRRKKNKSKNNNNFDREYDHDDDSVSEYDTATFLRSIATSSSSSSSSSPSDDDGMTPPRPPLRRQREIVTKKNTPLLPPRTVSSSSSSSSEQEETNRTTNQRRNNKNDPYSSIDYRAGTIYDVFSQKFCHFREIPKLIGTRIASALQTDRNQKPSQRLIDKCIDTVSDNSEKFLKITDRNSLLIVDDWKNDVKAKGAYILEINQSQDAVKKYFELFFHQQGNQNKKNIENVQAVNSNNNNDNRNLASMNKTMENFVEINFENIIHNNRNHHLDALLQIKRDLKIRGENFPVCTMFDDSPSSMLYHRLLEKSGPQCFSVTSVSWEAPPVLIEKNHPRRVFSFCRGKVVINNNSNILRNQSASFFEEGDEDRETNSFFPRDLISPVFLSVSLPEEILILSSRWETQKMYQLFSVPCDIYDTFGSKIEDNNESGGDGGGAFHGDKAVHQKDFYNSTRRRNGNSSSSSLTEPIYNFCVSGSLLFLIGRRTIAKVFYSSTSSSAGTATMNGSLAIRRHHDNNNNTCQNIFRTSSDIMTISPANYYYHSNSNESKFYLLVGLRDGRCGFITSSRRTQHQNASDLDFIAIAKYDNDPVISIGCCDLFLDDQKHVYVVTASQRVDIWEVQRDLIIGDHDENNFGDGRGGCRFVMTLHKGGKDDQQRKNQEQPQQTQFQNVDNNDDDDDDEIDYAEIRRNNLLRSGTNHNSVPASPLQFLLFSSSNSSSLTMSGVSRFAFVIGGRCYFEYDFENDAIILRRLISPNISNSNNNISKSSCGYQIDIVAKWEHVSSTRNHQNLTREMSQQQRAQQHRKRQEFARFNPQQAFYGSVSAGLDYETKRPCCFVVDEIHQFAVGVSL